LVEKSKIVYPCNGNFDLLFPYWWVRAKPYRSIFGGMRIIALPDDARFTQALLIISCFFLRFYISKWTNTFYCWYMCRNLKQKVLFFIIFSKVFPLIESRRNLFLKLMVFFVVILYFGLVLIATYVYRSISGLHLDTIQMDTVQMNTGQMDTKFSTRLNCTQCKCTQCKWTRNFLHRILDTVKMYH